MRLKSLVAVSVFGVAAFSGMGFCQAPASRLATDTIFAGLYNSAVVGAGGCRGIWQQGTKVGAIDDSDWTMYAQIDFGSACPPYFAIKFSADYLAVGKWLTFHLDSLAGTPIMYFMVPKWTGAGWTGDSTVFRDVINAPTGIHDVYMLALQDTSPLYNLHYCGGIADVHWFSFTTYNSVRNSIHAFGVPQKSIVATQGLDIVASLPAGFENVRIVSTNGSVVYSATAETSALRIPSARFPAGNYIFEVSAQDKILSQRFLLTR